MAGATWLIFNAEHFLWHMPHLDMFPVGDRIGAGVSLGAVLVLSMVLLLPDRPISEPATPPAA